MNICIDINNYNTNFDLCDDLIKNKVKFTVNACHPMLYLKNVYALFELHLAKRLNTLNIPPPSKPSKKSIEIAKTIYDSLLSKEPIYSIDIEEPYYGKNPFRYEFNEKMILKKVINYLIDLRGIISDNIEYDNPPHLVDDNKRGSQILTNINNVLQLLKSIKPPIDLYYVRTIFNELNVFVGSLLQGHTGYYEEFNNLDKDFIPPLEIPPTSYTDNNEYLHKKKCVYENKKDYVIPHNCGYSYELIIYTTDLLEKINKKKSINAKNELVLTNSTWKKIINLLLYYFCKMTISNGNHTFTECKETIVETITKITKIFYHLTPSKKKLIENELNENLYKNENIINISEYLDLKSLVDKFKTYPTQLHSNKINYIQDKRISSKNRILKNFKLHTIEKGTLLYRSFYFDNSFDSSKLGNSRENNFNYDPKRKDYNFNYKKCNGCWYTTDETNARRYNADGQNKVVMEYKVLKPIKLIEINDLKTWTMINDENRYSKISILLNMCFPLINGKILRNSDMETDRKLLVLLCKKYDIHGWYHGDMISIDPNNIRFPTEFAFCKLQKQFLEQVEAVQIRKNSTIIYDRNPPPTMPPEVKDPMTNINNSVSSFRRSPQPRRQRR